MPASWVTAADVTALTRLPVMRMSPSWRPRILLGGLACAGIAGAHTIAYWVVTPNPHEHASLLSSTGHSYWPYFVAVAIGGLIATFVGASFEERRRPGSARGPLSTFFLLTVLQLVGFGGLETIERAFAGGLDGLATDPSVLLGLALQVVVAAIGTGLLSGLVRAVRWLQQRCIPEKRSTIAVLGSATAVVSPPLSMSRSGFSWRGPPV